MIIPRKILVPAETSENVKSKCVTDTLFTLYDYLFINGAKERKKV